MKRGATSSRALHPLMSAADTGERVLKYLAMCLRLKCCWMYSCPTSSSYHALVSSFRGQRSDTGCVVGSLLGRVGSGFLARSSLMLVGAAEGVSSEVMAWLALARTIFRVACTRAKGS